MSRKELLLQGVLYIMKNGQELGKYQLDDEAIENLYVSFKNTYEIGYQDGYKEGFEKEQKSFEFFKEKAIEEMLKRAGGK